MEGKATKLESLSLKAISKDHTTAKAAASRSLLGKQQKLSRVECTCQWI